MTWLIKPRQKGLLENEKYCFVSYNDIVGAPSNDEEVTQ